MVPFSSVNPYHRLLADHLRRAGVASVVEGPLTPWSLLSARECDVVHTHWPEHVFVRPASGLRRTARASGSAAALALIRSTWAVRGIPFVHTLHNARPHDPTTPAVQANLLAALVRSADVLIVHSRLAERVAREDLRLRGPIVYAPHGRYGDALEPLRDDADLDERRRAYGVTDGAPVVLMFGQLRTDKRLPELVTRLREWSRQAWIVVAGAPAHRGPVAALRSIAGADPRLLLFDRRLDDDTVARLHGIADLSFQGQELSLMSGAAVLSLSLGVPIVVPLRSGAAELGAPPAVTPYTRHPREALDQALRSPRDLRRRAAREAALRQDWMVSAERHRDAYRLAQAIAARRRFAARRARHDGRR